jgi:hypothetical protein
MIPTGPAGGPLREPEEDGATEEPGGAVARPMSSGGWLGL